MSRVGDSIRAMASSSGGPGAIARDHPQGAEHHPAGCRPQLDARAGGASRRRTRPRRRPSTSAAMAGRAGRGLDERVGARGEAHRADAARLDVLAGGEEGERAVDVLDPVPAVVVLRAVALAPPAGVVERGPHSRAARASARAPQHHARSLLPPCRTRTAAPLRDGAYQPASSRPSEARKVTSSVDAAPAARRSARVTCGPRRRPCPSARGPRGARAGRRRPPRRGAPTAVGRSPLPSPRWRQGITAARPSEHAPPPRRRGRRSRRCPPPRARRRG